MKKKVLSLLMIFVMVLSLMACTSDKAEEKDSQKSQEESDANKNEKDTEDDLEKIAEMETIAEAYLDAMCVLDNEEMSKYMLPEAVKTEDELDAYESFENGIYTYKANGMSYEAELNMEYAKESVYESSVAELKVAVAGREEADIIDYDKIETIYIYVANVEGSMDITGIELDYVEMGITEEDRALFEAEYGMTYEEMLEEELENAVGESTLMNVYVAEYDGEWKVLYCE